MEREVLVTDGVDEMLDEILGLEPRESVAVGDAEIVPLVVVVEVRVLVRVGVVVLVTDPVFDGVGVDDGDSELLTELVTDKD